MADAPTPSSSAASAGGLPGASDPPALADRSVAALAGAGARYKAMSPARLPISREPCLTIPPGFSPSALLESPVLLTNLKVEPSPTTGTLNMPSIMNRIVHQEMLPSPREKTVGSMHDEGGSRDFEFKPHLRSSLQSAASPSSDLPKREPSIQTQIPNPASSSHLTTENKALSSSTAELHQMNDEKAMQDMQSDLNESSPLNLAEKSAEDGYNWRKYGQKHVKGSENPRSYYKCTHPNCEVKKLLERSLDGQITDVVYKGRHNHLKPQPNRRLSAGAVPSNQGEEKYDGVMSADDKPSSVLGHLVNQVNPAGMTEPFPGSTSDDDIDAGGGRTNLGDDVAEDDDMESKRRKLETAGIDAAIMGKPNREPRVVVQTVSEVDILDDGYRWRKYGQKVVKGNPNPRSYYKCTNIGCPVRKHVERASHDPKSVITTYEGKHNHEVPASRNASHETPAPTIKTIVHPINNNMPTLGGMMRACETRAFGSQYAQASESDTISLDLGVGISPNHGDGTNQMQSSVPDQMQYHQMHSTSSGYSNMGLPTIPVATLPGNSASSVYSSREDQSGEGFSFKTAQIDHSPNLCYSSAGNLVLGP